MIIGCTSCGILLVGDSTVYKYCLYKLVEAENEFTESSLGEKPLPKLDWLSEDELCINGGVMLFCCR